MENIRVAGEFNPRMTTGLVSGSLNKSPGQAPEPPREPSLPARKPGGLSSFERVPRFSRCKLEYSFGPDLPLFVPGFMVWIRKAASGRAGWPRGAETGTSERTQDFLLLFFPISQCPERAEGDQLRKL